MTSRARRCCARSSRWTPGHGAVLSAELAVSSLGVFEAYLNGRAAGHDVLSPGWSSYEWRLRYRTYDVTGLLRPATVLGISLGNGWSRGRLGWNGNRAFYGDRLAVIAQLEVTLRRWAPAAGGHRRDVAGRAVGDAGERPVRRADHRRPPGRRHRWMHPGAAPPGWGRVETLDFDTSRLTPYIGPPVIRHEAVTPVAIWLSPSGRTLVDFGQNLVGWLRFTAHGAAGTEITVRHGEVLEDGELGVRPLRSAKATDRFVLSGERGPLRAHQDLPRLPLRRDHRLAGRADPRRAGGGCRPLRPAAHRSFRMLRPDARTSCTAT